MSDTTIDASDDATTPKSTERFEAGRWVAVVGALPAPVCDEIERVCIQIPPLVPRIAGSDGPSDHRVGTTRRVEVSAAHADVHQLVHDIGHVLNDRHFGLCLTGIVRVPEMVEYPARGGHFHWHDDYGLERPVSRRKLTVIVQLSDADDYRGGALEVADTPRPLPAGRGTVIAFPAYVRHRITPVTAGTRRALVGWLAGPPLR